MEQVPGAVSQACIFIRRLVIPSSEKADMSIRSVLFSSILLPPICSHTSSPHTIPPSEIVYHLDHPLYSLALTPSDHKVYEVRLPKLQVGPNVAKRKTGVEAAHGAAEAFAKRGAVLRENGAELANSASGAQASDNEHGLVEWRANMQEYMESLVCGMLLVKSSRFSHQCS